MLNASFQLLFKKLRLSNPWNYKAPFLIAVPYYMILLGQIERLEAVVSILLSFATILGIAGFGYFLNDWADIKEDQAIGKANVVADLSAVQRSLLLSILLVAAIGPWFYFPLNRFSIGLLFAEFLLFILYSLPPFRFKERGLLGVLTDALYAHANPILLAAITFHLMAVTRYSNLVVFLIALVSWQLILGIRNIVLHQVKDYTDDLHSGTQTFVTQTGLQKSMRLLAYLIVPLELGTFIYFAWMVNQEIAFFIPAYIGFLLLTFLQYRYLKKQALPNKLRQRLYLYLDDFYIEWLPLLFLLALSLKDPFFLLLLILHLLLFKNGLQHLFRDLKHFRASF